MKPLPRTSDLLAVAPRILWLEEPQAALADPIRFMAYLMTYGTPADVITVRQYVSADEFREAIENAPPGIMDERSWSYWNAVAGHYPPPPMPQRRLPS